MSFQDKVLVFFNQDLQLLFFSPQGHVLNSLSRNVYFTLRNASTMTLKVSRFDPLTTFGPDFRHQDSLETLTR